VKSVQVSVKARLATQPLPASMPLSPLPASPGVFPCEELVPHPAAIEASTMAENRLIFLE
jgi:hypothetical protein